jgi:hypothetical protein
MRARFVQARAGNGEASPKGGLTRTGRYGKRGSESERGSHSDRLVRETGERVRKGVSFGQAGAGNERPSPNTVPIRTGQGEKREAESECRN